MSTPKRSGRCRAVRSHDWRRAIMGDKYPPRVRPVSDADTEIARLTSRCEGFRYELAAVRDNWRQERERIGEILLDLKASSDVGHWTIADRIEQALDKPAHPDDLKAAA
jgi:hypothetical protein